MSAVATHPVPDTPFTDEVLIHVKSVAHKLSQKYRRNVQDEEDIRSQLIERLMKAFPKFDPRLSCYYTFAQNVVDRERGHVERKLNQMHREELATVSIYGRTSSSDDGRARWIDVVTGPCGNMANKQNKIDLRETVGRLGSRDRWIASRFAEGYAWTEIAQKMGIPVAEFFRKVKPSFLKNLRHFYHGTEKRQRVR